jgi:hypothetical protein
MSTQAFALSYATLDLSGLQQVVMGVVGPDDTLVFEPLRGWRKPKPNEIGAVINGDTRKIHLLSEIIEGVTVYRPIELPRHRNLPEDTEVGVKRVIGAGPIPLDTKPSNPKDIAGSSKIPLHLWPTTATALGSMAMLDGALKYGRSNFRAVGVRASIYYDALLRHLNAWFEGENDDPDSNLPHLAHVLACAAIIVDAQSAGKLTDDRVIPAEYRGFVDGLTPYVERLKQKHAHRSPKHYTKADQEAEAQQIIRTLKNP